MKSTTSKWLLGCGIGCGVIIVIGVIVCSGGYFLLKGTVAGFHDAQVAMDSLTARFGSAEDYIPPLDGRIPEDNLERFLFVRDSLKMQGEELTELIVSLSTRAVEQSKNENNKAGDVLGLMGKGFSLVPKMSGFIKLRNELLLANEINIGEYKYIYILGYYSWLHKSMQDGPEFNLVGTRSKSFEYNYDDESATDSGKLSTREQREQMIKKQARRFMILMFENSLTEMNNSQTGSTVSVRKWKKEIEAELARLEDDEKRIPWEDNMPKSIVNSLRPFKERLEAGYLHMLSNIEMQGISDFNK